mmetsp:Transcript_12738/g.38919  ORF Transcript_12738/g.38919 Transcript_12738/m.38919 type:complete len:96 (-) Transcript_12738:1094-1381(-)
MAKRDIYTPGTVHGIIDRRSTNSPLIAFITLDVDVRLLAVDQPSRSCFVTSHCLIQPGMYIAKANVQDDPSVSHLSTSFGLKAIDHPQRRPGIQL